MKHTTITLATMAACILTTGCKKTECYRDAQFEAMLQDSAYVHSGILTAIKVQQNTSTCIGTTM